MKAVAAVMVLAWILVVPTAVAVDYSEEERVQADAVTLEAAGAAAVNENPSSAGEEDQMIRFDWDVAGQVMPSDSAAAPGLSAFEALLLSFLAPSPSGAAPALDVLQAEVDDVQAEGIGAESQGTASEAGVVTQTDLQVGAHSTTVDQAVEAPALADGRGSGSPAARPKAAPDPEPAPPAEPQPAGPSGNLATSSLEARLAEIPFLVAVATTVAVATATTGLTLLAAPGWRSAAWRAAKKAGALALFSRIAQEDILNHERRSELLEFIKQNPGERVEVARKTLGISNGSMHYHIKVLKDRGLVRLLREGGLARLYPAGPRITPQPYVPSQRRRFLDVLAAQPGLTQRDLSSQLLISERMVSYHVGTLVEQGFVEIHADGPRKRLFLRPQAN